MPAKSAAQQKAAGAALSARRGDTPKSEVKGASKSMLSMCEEEPSTMGSTKRNGKPEHKTKHRFLLPIPSKWAAPAWWFARADRGKCRPPGWKMLSPIKPRLDEMASDS